jgi:hypothetical protein
VRKRDEAQTEAELARMMMLSAEILFIYWSYARQALSQATLLYNVGNQIDRMT